MTSPISLHGARWPCCVLWVLLISFVSTSFAVTEVEGEENEPARFYRTSEEQREAGAQRQLTPWLTLTNLLELEWSKDHISFANDTGHDRQLNRLATAQLGLTAAPWEPFKAELIFEYDTDADKLEADEATIVWKEDPWELVVGKQYLPFGEFFSHFVSGPLLEFGETRDTGAMLSYAFGEGLDLSLSVYRGRARKEDRNDDGLDWTLALEAWPTDKLSLGISYQADLADADERLLADENDRYARKVPGLSGYLLWAADDYEVTLEALGATRSFLELESDRNRPVAWNMEFAHFPHPWFEWALRIEGSQELEDAPKLQYGAAATLRLRRNAAMTMEFLHGRFRENLATDDDDKPYDHVNRFGIQLSIVF